MTRYTPKLDSQRTVSNSVPRCPTSDQVPRVLGGRSATAWGRTEPTLFFSKAGFDGRKGISGWGVPGPDMTHAYRPNWVTRESCHKSEHCRPCDANTTTAVNSDGCFTLSHTFKKIVQWQPDMSKRDNNGHIRKQMPGYTTVEMSTVRSSNLTKTELFIKFSCETDHSNENELKKTFVRINPLEFSGGQLIVSWNDKVVRMLSIQAGM